MAEFDGTTVRKLNLGLLGMGVIPLRAPRTEALLASFTLALLLCLDSSQAGTRMLEDDRPEIVEDLLAGHDAARMGHDLGSTGVAARDSATARHGQGSRPGGLQ